MQNKSIIVALDAVTLKETSSIIAELDLCFQGFIGWFMVSSGLVENTDVSHYRLASHLSIAFLILSLVFWFLLQNLEIKKNTKKINFFFLSVFLFFLIIQIILGAFLAGLDGGLIYNTLLYSDC